MKALAVMILKTFGSIFAAQKYTLLVGVQLEANLLYLLVVLKTSIQTGKSKFIIISTAGNVFHLESTSQILKFTDDK